LHRKYADQIVMIGVAVGERTPHIWRDYITGHKMTWHQYLERVPLDPRTGKAAGAPERVSRDSSADHTNATWSRDGRELAFASFPSNGADAVIIIASTGTAQQREIRPDIPGGGMPPIGAFMDWSPDGRSLVVNGGVVPGGPRPKGAFMVDARSGETTTIIHKPDNTVAVHQSKWLPDGRSVIYLENLANVVTRDLDTGEERKVYEAGRAFGGLNALALSPNGTSVAFRHSSPRTPTSAANVRIMVMALAGTAAPSVVGEHAGPFTWSADARFLISVDQGPNKPQYDVWRVPVGGGRPESLGLTLDRAVAHVAASPDGKWLALVMSGQPQAPGAYVIERLVPGMAR
jgi:Tol biopolymer transport system component